MLTNGSTAMDGCWAEEGNVRATSCQTLTAPRGGEQRYTRAPSSPQCGAARFMAAWPGRDRGLRVPPGPGNASTGPTIFLTCCDPMFS